MDFDKTVAIGLQQALLDKETARAQLAEANTRIMMLTAALEHVTEDAAYPALGYHVQAEIADALEWSEDDE